MRYSYIEVDEKVGTHRVVLIVSIDDDRQKLAIRLRPNNPKNSVSMKFWTLNEVEKNTKIGYVLCQFEKTDVLLTKEEARRTISRFSKDDDYGIIYLDDIEGVKGRISIDQAVSMEKQSAKQNVGHDQYMKKAYAKEEGISQGSRLAGLRGPATLAATPMFNMKDQIYVVGAPGNMTFKVVGIFHGLNGDYLYIASSQSGLTVAFSDSDAKKGGYHKIS